MGDIPNVKGPKRMTATDMGVLQKLAESRESNSAKRYFSALAMKGYSSPAFEVLETVGKSGDSFLKERQEQYLVSLMKMDFEARMNAWTEDPDRAIELPPAAKQKIIREIRGDTRKPRTQEEFLEDFKEKQIELAGFEQAIEFYGNMPAYQRRLEAKYDTGKSGDRSHAKIRRPVLEFWGNVIRDRLDHPFSKKMFERYWRGFGDYEMNAEEFQDLIVKTKDEWGNSETRPAKDGEGKPIAPISFNKDGKKFRAVKTDFYESGAGNILGDAWLVYEADKPCGPPVGLFDRYDFNWKPWLGKDSRKDLAAELKTRMVDLASKTEPRTRDFVIRYGIVPEELP